MELVEVCEDGVHSGEGYAVSETERLMDGRRCCTPVNQLRKKRRNGWTSLVLLR